VKLSLAKITHREIGNRKKTTLRAVIIKNEGNCGLFGPSQLQTWCGNFLLNWLLNNGFVRIKRVLVCPAVVLKE